MSTTPTLRTRSRLWLAHWRRPAGVTALIALAVTLGLLPLLENRFLDLLISAQVVGFTLMFLLYPLMTSRLSGLRLVLSIGAALAVGAVAGTVLVVLVKGRDLSQMFLDTERLWSFGFTAGTGFVVGLVTVMVMAARARIARAEAEVLRVEAERQALARKTAEAELQVIRAQIEPHFLINTLANLSALMHDSPAQAQAMLDNLIDYLQAALPRLRGDVSTLRNELSMASAYVAILQVRMGDRLHAAFDIPPALLRVAFPPMMLITLIENAIQHGLNPKPEGGTVRVRAEQHGKQLVLSVSDDGIGLAAAALRPRPVHSGAAPGGIGVTNIRERLHAMYGPEARLELESATPCGTIARIELPMGTHRD